MTKSWVRGFEYAKKASLKSNSKVTSKKLGAALMSGNKLLSVGYNIFGKSHPIYQDTDEEGNDFLRNTHAELMCLTQRKHYEDRNLTLYVYRESDSGHYACSRPCRICMKLLESHSIKRVRFINELGNFEENKIGGN